ARGAFAGVHATRVRHGLRPLAADERLAGLALAVARQMAIRGYFGHTDPSGVTFRDRLRAAGFRYGYAAENLAFDRDEAHANAAFLQSRGHYENIVDPHPRKLGIAVLAAGEGEIFYVEEFSDCPAALTLGRSSMNQARPVVRCNGNEGSDDGASRPHDG